MICGVRRADQLPNDIEVLKRLVLEQQAALESHLLEIERLKLILARLRRARFGRSSEALDQQIEQLELTLEELEAAQAATEARTVPVVKKAPEKPFRQELPEHLPRETMVHEAPVAAGCTCPECGGALREMGKDITEVLERIPARYKVVRHIRPKFSCAKCQTVVQAPAASRPIAGGIAGASVIAHVLVSKYCDHTPLYRQSQIYAREGVELPRSTMAEWVGQATQLCDPVVEAIARHVLQGQKLHADDTPVPVLCPGKGTTKTGRLWVYVRDDRSSADLSPPAVLFRYSPDRKAIYPNRHLESFSGVLQADAYAGFNPLYERTEDPLLEAACWAHARRKFYDITSRPTRRSLVRRSSGSPIYMRSRIRSEVDRRMSERLLAKPARVRFWTLYSAGSSRPCVHCRRNRSWRWPSAMHSRVGRRSYAIAMTAASTSTITPQSACCVQWPLGERIFYLQVPTVAASVRQRRIR
jgi:transposase